MRRGTADTMAGPVFISHSSRDLKVARAICDAIELRGMRCWISARDVGPGDNFGDAIVDAIESAKVMVLVFSSNANNSEEIKKEIALASQHRVSVIPVRVEDITPSQAFRYELATRQWIDMFVDWDQALKRLTDKIALIQGVEERVGETPPRSPQSPPPPPAAPRRVGAMAGVAAAFVVVMAAGAFFWARPLASGGGSELPTPPAHVATNAPEPVAPKAVPPTQVVATAPPSSPHPAESDARPAVKANPTPPLPDAAPAPTPVVAAALAPAGQLTASSDSGARNASPDPSPVPAAVAPAAPVVAAVRIELAAAAPVKSNDANQQPAAALAPPAVPDAGSAPPVLAKPIVAASLSPAVQPAASPDPSPALGAAAVIASVAPAQADPPKPRINSTDSDQQPAAKPAPLASDAGPTPPASPAPVIVASLSPTVQPATSPDPGAHNAGVKSFKDCDTCPEMVVIPHGAALIGSPRQETARMPHESAPSEAIIPTSFAVGRYDVTFDEWDACVAAGGCNSWRPGDFTWGRGRQPVIFVSWTDAEAYVAWLRQKTGRPYRLLSETEWEYAARGCTTTACPNQPFWFGAITPEIANYDARYAYLGSPKGVARRRALPVDEGPPNPFGLYNMLGNVRQWVEDCWSANPGPPPPAGAPRLDGDCADRVTRGGSFDDKPQELRAAARSWQTIDTQSQKIGFRVARALDP